MDVDAVVKAWRQVNGVTHDGDFAYFFSTMGEAQAEAGELVANAWRDVRRRVSSGVDRSLVALLERHGTQQPSGSTLWCLWPSPFRVCPGECMFWMSWNQGNFLKM